MANMSVGVTLPYSEENKKLLEENKVAYEAGTPLEALYDYINALEIRLGDSAEVVRQLKADLMIATGRIEVENQEAKDGSE